MSVDARSAQLAAKQAHELSQHAFISILEPARIAELAASAGDGPLAGMPFAVKDNIDVAGVPTTAACPALDAPAPEHAHVVARLIAAGAIPVAKTNMDQFATGLVGTRSPYGACHSVYSPDHVSGGSSSGSAVAVASGVVPLALGTDTAGSGRVPAAFNGLVGMKPSRGLVSNTGLLPACPSLDCITTFTTTVTQAAAVFDVVVGYDAADPYSRPMPPALPAGVARHMRVIAVPAGPLALDPEHEQAWQQALAHAATVALLVPVDIEPFLAAARLLYEAPFVSERTAAFGALLEPDGPHLDPTVRSIVLRGAEFTAAQSFAAAHELARLRRLTEAAFVSADALLLPVTPWHPTLAQVAADPIGANSCNGVFTNMTNLLDLCAIALPAGERADGLPFGIQLLAPAFGDVPLLELAATWTGERVMDAWAPEPHRTLVAVAGAHLSGQPANPQLIGLGGHLHARARTAAGYRMYTVPGPFPRPGLIGTGDGPSTGIEIEVWSLPTVTIDQLVATIAPPLLLGPLELDDGTTVLGFIAEPGAADPARDITDFGGWRAFVTARERLQR
ncbi:MAG: allophanate hydrolase [Candidatus Nanopelagicales bacterium]|nr:allophanate hydrolase [Candidatus Nanopelagicales bacterium]